MSTLCITPENELSASELGSVQYLSSNEMLFLGGHFINFCPCSTSEDVSSLWSSPESVIQDAIIKKGKFETHISWFTGVQSIMSSIRNKILEGSKQRKEFQSRTHVIDVHLWTGRNIWNSSPAKPSWTSDKKLNLRDKFHQVLPLKPRNVKALCVTVDIHILQQPLAEACTCKRLTVVLIYQEIMKLSLSKLSN